MTNARELHRRLRISLSAAHSMADVDLLVQELQACGLPVAAGLGSQRPAEVGGLVTASASALSNREGSNRRSKL